MDEQKSCKQCSQSKDCQSIYQRLGSVKGPSIVVKVIVAFLLPLIVFIGSLAAFEQIFSKAIESKQLQTPLSLLLALSITFSAILIIKAINRQISKSK